MHSPRSSLRLSLFAALAIVAMPAPSAAASPGDSSPPISIKMVTKPDVQTSVSDTAIMVDRDTAEMIKFEIRSHVDVAQVAPRTRTNGGVYNNHIRPACMDGSTVIDPFVCDDGVCDTEGEDCSAALAETITYSTSHNRQTSPPSTGASTAIAFVRHRSRIASF